MGFRTEDVHIELVNGANIDFIELDIFINSNLKKTIYLQVKDCDIVNLTKRSKC